MSSLCVAGPEGIPPDMSCGNGVEDELAPEQEEPVANLGTTIGSKFPVQN